MFDNTPEKYQNLLSQFPDVNSPSVKLSQSKHTVFYFIETKGLPVYSSLLAVTKQDIQKVLDTGIIQP